jgi:hypothetical protein
MKRVARTIERNWKVKVIHWIVKDNQGDSESLTANIGKVIEDKGTFSEVKARLFLSSMGIYWRSGKKAIFTVDQKREYEYRLKGEFRTTVMVFPRVAPNNELTRERIKHRVREVYRDHRGNQSFIPPVLS